jgi:hypothetical protein
MNGNGVLPPVQTAASRVIRRGQFTFSPHPISVYSSFMPAPSYSIHDALPRLYALSLPANALASTFYIPNEGFPNFLQYRIRVFAHTLLRAITHDFVHTDSLPGFPRLELLKLHEWIEILMLHFVRSNFKICLRLSDPRDQFAASGLQNSESPFGETLRWGFLLARGSTRHPSRSFSDAEALRLLV